MSVLLAVFLGLGKEGFVSGFCRVFRKPGEGLGWSVDAAFPFIGGHFHGLGTADFFKAGEVSTIWEVAALVRLDRLDAAVPSRIQKAAGPVGLIH